MVYSHLYAIYSDYFFHDRHLGTYTEGLSAHYCTRAPINKRAFEVAHVRRSGPRKKFHVVPGLTAGVSEDGRFSETPMVPTIWRTGPWPQGWPDQPVIGTKKPVSQIASGAAKDRLASPKFHASSMHAPTPPGGRGEAC